MFTPVSSDCDALWGQRPPHSLRCYPDVREPKQIESAIAQTVEQLGPRLFVSVANAGVTQVRPLLECTPEYVHVVRFLANSVLRRAL